MRRDFSIFAASSVSFSSRTHIAFTPRTSGSQHRRGRGHQKQGRGRGQAYAVAVQEDAGRNVVDGMLLISQSWAHVLFDTGATHSFVSVSLVQALQLDVENCDRPLVLSSPMGGL